MFTDILWRFLILETFVMGALCCSCAYEHPHKHFCKSEFVLLVDIHEIIKLPMAKAFRIVIKNVFKEFSNNSHNRKSHPRSWVGKKQKHVCFKGDLRELDFIQKRSVILEMPRVCPDDHMRTGDKYVIFGHSVDGRIYTNLCRGNKPWRMTTIFFRRGLARYYKRNCDCDPKISYNTRECELKCYFMKRRGKHCKWVNSSSFRLCKQLQPKD